MADKIDIIISGDKSLNENVKQAKKIETSIENAYKSWSKLADGKGNAHISETVKQMEKLTVQSKKYNKEIETQTKEQKKLDQITKEYNATLKRSNQIQTSYATDLQKTNAQLEVLKKNQKLLKAEGKELTAEYQRNKVAIKEISAEYRKLEKIQLQEIQMKKTLTAALAWPSIIFFLLIASGYKASDLWLIGIILIMFIIIIIMFIQFESRKITSKEISLVAVLSAVSAVSRIPFAAIPSVQPCTFIIMCTGYVFGPTAGFMVGATTALVSNIFLGQGPWTFFQMFAWGVIGASASLLNKLNHT